MRQALGRIESGAGGAVAGGGGRSRLDPGRSVSPFAWPLDTSLAAADLASPRPLDSRLPLPNVRLSEEQLLDDFETFREINRLAAELRKAQAEETSFSRRFGKAKRAIGAACRLTQQA